MNFDTPGSNNDIPTNEDMQKLASEGEELLDADEQKTEEELPTNASLDIAAFEGDKKVFEEDYKKSKKGEVGLDEVLNDWTKPGGHWEQSFAANSAREMLEQINESAIKRGEKGLTPEQAESFIARMINDAKKVSPERLKRHEEELEQKRLAKEKLSEKYDRMLETGFNPPMDKDEFLHFCMYPLTHRITDSNQVSAAKNKYADLKDNMAISEKEFILDELLAKEKKNIEMQKQIDFFDKLENSTKSPPQPDVTEWL